MVADLLSGQIDFAVTALPPVQPHLKTGALRAIGVLTNRRVSIAPEIPTFVEQGFPNFNMDVWVAVLGPKGMGAATVRKLHDALVTAMDNPASKRALENQGNIVNVTTPAEASEVIRHDVARYSALAKKINLTPQ
ncbi:hypothetical protein J7E49_22305 [Variovorax paradoxus]|nr:hypothetical protein [Variovorax paradoxus]